jgi:hypothetical protein
MYRVRCETNEKVSEFQGRNETEAVFGELLRFDLAKSQRKSEEILGGFGVVVAWMRSGECVAWKVESTKRRNFMWQSPNLETKGIFVLILIR